MKINRLHPFIKELKRKNVDSVALAYLAVAWIYELTDKGRKRTEEVDRDANLRSRYNRQLNYIVIGALLKADDTAARLVEKAYAEGDPILVSPLCFFLPEDWPGLPMLQQALDKPDLVELFNLRRENISAGTGRVLPRY